jgi:outer membrane protein assembly factor BamB
MDFRVIGRSGHRVIGGATIIEVVTLLRITLPIIFASLAIASPESQLLPSSVRWSVALSARAVASPTIAGSVIVVGLQSGSVIAYSAKDGKEAWRVQMRADQAIVSDQTLLFVAAGEMIRALDAADGKVLWEAPSGTVTAPLLVQGGWVIAASAGRLTAFREIDGAKVWSRESPPQHARPTIEGDNLYVPLDEGRLLALDLRTGSERWTRFPAKGALSEVLAFPDRVFVGASDKWFYAYDADDGEIDWKVLIGTVLRGRPASDNTRVVITGMDNLVRAFDRGNGRLEWHMPVPYRPTGPVVIASAVVVPGAAADIRALVMATGKPAGQIKLEQPLVLPPVFSGTGRDALMAAVTGTITGEWTLLLAGPPAPQAPPG